MKRVSISWSKTAVTQLRALPPKVARGLYKKADELYGCDDPRQAHKPLQGPLKGYYRITYARYRAIYRVLEEELPNGDSLVHLKVQFIAAGKREERSKQDIYRVAEKIIQLGIIGHPEPDED